MPKISQKKWKQIKEELENKLAESGLSVIQQSQVLKSFNDLKIEIELAEPGDNIQLNMKV